MEIAVADFPLLGMRTKMMVSVLVDTSSPARSVASSSSESGLPCASVRLSRPTSRTSIAPSSPPSPSATEEKWLMPDSNDRILPHATPVPTTMARATATAMTRVKRAGICPGYLRDARRPGSADRRARLECMPDRIVIAGAGGMVGRYLAAQARQQGRDVLALTSAEWDITDPAAAERFIQSGDVVINCAAYTRVDAAEDDQERAHAVNAVGPENVAQACARVGANLIHISTDYVFSGAQHRPYEIDDETGPLSVYARTKLAGELSVLAAMPDAHIVRTAWVYEGADGSDFVAVMRRLACGDGPVDVVADQIGSPTYVGDLVGALLEIADGSIREPVLYAANDGEVSRFDQARAVFEAVGADPERVRPVGTDAHPRPAPRPPYSALASRKSAEAGLTPLRPWRDALAVAVDSAG